jgi:paraquat-inducible protein B
MSRKADPKLIGAFVLGGAGLLLLAIILLADGSFWRDRPTYTLYFEGSTTGLQVGSPVVFRGVKIGSVESIGLSIDKESFAVLVPVRFRADSPSLEHLEGGQASIEEMGGRQALLEHGLRARLKTWSFLTGQLYIDLDFYPEKPAQLHGRKGEAEIPTLPTEVQEFANKLDKLNIEKLLDDVSVISNSIRKLVSAPEAASALKNLDATLANLQALTDSLNHRSSTLADDTRVVLQESAATLRTSRDALTEAASTLRAGRETLSHIDESAGNIAKLTRPDAGPILALTEASKELAATARALRETAGEDSSSAVNLNEMMKETTAAARALRALAEAIETQPESLLHGRSDREDAP